MQIDYDLKLCGTCAALPVPKCILCHTEFGSNKNTIPYAIIVHSSQKSGGCYVCIEHIQQIRELKLESLYFWKITYLTPPIILKED